MKSAFFAFAAVLVLAAPARSETVYRIEIGKDPSKYGTSELQRRVWELERAVWQLQQKVFMLETSRPAHSDSWLCKLSAMGETYTATGGSKAVATNAVMEKCKAARGGDGFFCKNVECEQ